MRIVEANEARAILVVQGKAVAQPMGPLRARRYLLHNEPDRVVAGFVDRESFAIKVEKDAKARITVDHGNYQLSLIDNEYKQ
jgi:hypothetical protein